MRTRAAFAVLITSVAACASDSSESNGGEYVECVHVTTPDVSRTDTDVLPVGRCRPSKEVCELTLREPCPCPSQVPRTFYACSCQGGQWACQLTSMDAGICRRDCVVGDSGTD
jgi:hypothetical protein